MATVSIAEIGEKLRQARENKSLTIDQAQKQTHIHSKVIAALEDGKCDEILNPTYVKSFLKTYSRYLGLDSKQIISDYESSHPVSSRPNVNLKKEEPKRTVSFLKFFYIIISLIVIAGMIFLATFLWKKAATFLKRPKPAKAAAKYGTASPASKKQTSKKGTKLIDLKLKEVARSESSAKIYNSQISIPKNMPFNLALKVKQPVLVELKKDGIVIFKRVLEPGTVESFRANDSINIFVAKAEAIEIILNGKAVELPAKGVIRDLEITRKGIRIK